jgi:hypothetical protein
VPVNDFADRSERSDSPFNLTKEPFDFPLGLGVFDPCNDVFDLMLVEEIPELVLSMFTVPG